ncbi:telomere binding protein [Coemansia spiralis]|uniref:Telomere binding protein n=2 Tax=Coemansia TaxID=4863 RepID=A0A9W8KYI9_9FUNG|nr:telomere binding protein [Coemansia umbellata]KAJ2622051.1 telomere binding protein [Coemansia sp. RSA 1358]KAJ2677656.1 telomere binding protein [Coemansia spiralis]
MDTRDEIKRRFKDLERRIDELVQNTHGALKAVTESAKIESLEPSANKTPAILEIDSQQRNRVEIAIPGITNIRKPLITPIAEAKESQGLGPDKKKEKGSSSVLQLLLQLPLVAIGCVDLSNGFVNRGLREEEWVQWWIDTGSTDKEASRDSRRVKLTIVERFIGPWFSRTVMGCAAMAVVGSPALMDIVLNYLGSNENNDSVHMLCGWNTMTSVISALSAKNTALDYVSVGSLTLATRLLAHAVSSGLLSPQHTLKRIESASDQPINKQSRAREWTDYLQFACTLPERVANRINPGSIPQSLRPQQYFARLAQEAVRCSSSQSLVVELWTKLCRVGQAEYLCTELAVAMVTEALECVNGVLEDGRGWAHLANTVCMVAMPFRDTLLSGVVRQLERIAGEYKGVGVDRVKFNCILALCLAALIYWQLEEPQAVSVEHAVTSVLLAQNKYPALSGAGGGLVARFQATAFALQLLSGRQQPNSEIAGTVDETTSVLNKIAGLLPKKAPFPDLLFNSLQCAIIPTWSSPGFVANAQADTIKPLTMLVLMCAGQLSPSECEKLSMSGEFADAIPRFLDAPTPLVRLSGVIVADHIVCSAHVSIASEDTADDKVDFGLDDIIRDAERTDQPTVRASAQYIREMREYAQPISVQWADTPGASTGITAASEQPLQKAVEYIRTYSGEADELAVLAPRQSSLTAAESGPQSGFVKPRTPVFLHDCLAYLKPQQQSDIDAEKVKIGLFALTKCIETATTKSVEELWLQTATRVFYTYNRGPEHLDNEWDRERLSALVVLAIRVPAKVGSYLADRSCDRNMTLRDRELALSAIATACLRLSGNEGSDHEMEKPKTLDVDQLAQDIEKADLLSVGRVVRRSRRLDITVKRASGDPKYPSIVGPMFYFPLLAQFGKSDMTADSVDVRQNVGQLERYLNTLGVILYTAGAATHQIPMARGFWQLTRLLSHVDAPQVVDALLFGIDVTLSPTRSLSVPTLAREFRADIADMLGWISQAVERARLMPSTMAHAARIVDRLKEIQASVYQRATSDDFNRFTSIL